VLWGCFILWALCVGLWYVMEAAGGAMERGQMSAVAIGCAFEVFLPYVILRALDSMTRRPA
jgi:hypothetical protein